MFDEKEAYATVPPHWHSLSYIQVQCYPPVWLLHSDLRDSNNGDCHVMKMTYNADSNSNMGLLTQQTSCCTHGVLYTENKMLIMTMKVTSDWMMILILF